MSQQKPSSLELMCYFDGELSAERMAEVEAWLEHDASSRDTLASLSLSRRLIGDLEEQRQAGASDSIADAVMARIEAPDRGEPNKAGQVVELRAKPQPRGWPLAVVAFGGLAAAAAVALLVWQLAGQFIVQAPSASRSSVPAGASQVLASAPPGISDQDQEPTVSVDAVDFGAHTGTIFYVPTDTGTTTVVWLADDEVGGTR